MPSKLNLDTSNFWCCANNCYNLLTHDDIVTCRILLRTRFPHRKMQKQFVLDHIAANHSGNEIFFHIAGSSVCRLAWLRCFDLSSAVSFMRIVGLWKQGNFLHQNEIFQCGIGPQCNYPCSLDFLVHVIGLRKTCFNCHELFYLSFDCEKKIYVKLVLKYILIFND